MSNSKTQTVRAEKAKPQLRPNQPSIADIEKAMADERAPKRRFNNLMFTPPELENF